MKKTILLFTFFCFSFFAAAQEEQSDVTPSSWESQIELELNLEYGIPMDFLRRNIEENLVGFGSGAMIRVKSTPSVFVGLDIMHFKYDEMRTDYVLDYDGYLENYDTRTRASILGLHGKFRIAPSYYRVWTPYVELLLGTKHMGTRTSIYSYFDDSEDALDSYQVDSAWALSYGGSVGLSRRIYTYEGMDFMINLVAQYLAGTGVNYNVLEEEYDLGLSPGDAYTSKFSTTNLLLVQIGLTLAFGDE